MESIIELLESTAQVPLTNNYHLVSLFGTIGTLRAHAHDTHDTHDTRHTTHVTDAHVLPDVLAKSPLGGENLEPWVGRLSRLLVDHVQRDRETPNANRDGVQALWCCVQLAAASTDCAGEVDRRVVRLLAHADWVGVGAGRDNDSHRFELSVQGVANLLAACFSGVDDDAHDQAVGVCRVDEAEKLLRAFDAWLARVRGDEVTRPTFPSSSCTSPRPGRGLRGPVDAPVTTQSPSRLFLSHYALFLIFSHSEIFTWKSGN